MYVFDTSALIEAWVRSYPPDSFPGFWVRMDEIVRSGHVVSPEAVLDELRVRDDDLHEWVKKRGESIIRPTSRELMYETRLILASHPTLTKTGTGRSAADPFVIALAASCGCPLVTQEKGGSVSKPRIPYVCGDRGVRCIDLLAFIRAEGWTF